MDDRVNGKLEILNSLKIVWLASLRTAYNESAYSNQL